MFVCLSVAFFVPLNFSFIWRRHYSRWRAANIDHCSALMAIEQWGFFSVPHLLWHGTTVYKGHLRGPVTLTPIAERLAVELSLPVLRLRSIAAGIRTPNSPLAVQCSNQLRHRRGQALQLIFLIDTDLEIDWKAEDWHSLINHNITIFSIHVSTFL